MIQSAECSMFIWAPVRFDFMMIASIRQLTHDCDTLTQIADTGFIRELRSLSIETNLSREINRRY